MIWLRSLLFNIAFWAWIMVCGVLCAPLLLHQRAARHVPFWWIDGSLFLLRSIAGQDYELRGQENKPSEPAIYAAKHQSALDTLVLWKELDGPAFVLKKELLYFPIFGWYLWRADNIAIDRSAGGKALEQIVAQAGEKMAAGRNVVIFPEGTRTRPGTHKSYKRGVGVLHEVLKRPLVPIALNTGMFWGRNAFTKKPGRAVFHILPAITEPLDAATCRKRIQHQIETASDALLNA